MQCGAVMEHRWGVRTKTELLVRLIFPPGTTGSGRLLDISMSGSFVRTSLQFPLLSLVYIEPLRQPLNLRDTCQLAAYVVRRAPGGYGLEWCDPDMRVIHNFGSSRGGDGGMPLQVVSSAVA